MCTIFMICIDIAYRFYRMKCAESSIKRRGKEDGKKKTQKACKGTKLYVVVYSNCWEDHLVRLRRVLTRFAEVSLTINLAKSEFGHLSGCNGWVKPCGAKMQSIVEYPPPSNKRELLRFLGTAGYYRRFCKNF